MTPEEKNVIKAACEYATVRRRRDLDDRDADMQVLEAVDALRKAQGIPLSDLPAGAVFTFVSANDPALRWVKLRNRSDGYVVYTPVRGGDAKWRGLALTTFGPWAVVVEATLPTQIGGQPI